MRKSSGQHIVCFAEHDFDFASASLSALFLLFCGTCGPNEQVWARTDARLGRRMVSDNAELRIPSTLYNTALLTYCVCLLQSLLSQDAGAGQESLT
jgi:hypothetical protein